MAARPARIPQLSGFDLIAEVKLASPSAGRLVEAGDATAEVVRRAALYAGAGACAISVLTEPTRFGGSLDHLRAVASVSRVPVMRKDFLVELSQVVEARACGADGVLLIARMLDDARFAEMLSSVIELGMFALIEAFDERDIDRSLAAIRSCSAGQDRDIPRVLLGINARDLSTLAIDPARLERLAPRLPRDVPCVAESGIESPGDARSAAVLGYRFALVGSALSISTDPARLCCDMLRTARGALT